jgi:two-component system NarL family sensor kinase
LALLTDLLGLGSGWVWLLDAETNQLYNAASYNLPPYLQEPVRMSGSWCLCTDALRSGALLTKNVDVIECSRLSPAVRKRATRLTAGLRYHASVPLQFQGRPLGVLNVTGPSWRKLTDDELRMLSMIALQMSATIERSRLAEEHARLARADERASMARELHDTLVQSLAAIALQLESAMKTSEDAPTRDRLQRALDAARSASVDARRAVSELRGTPLSAKPLAQALTGLARGFMSDTGVKATIRAEADIRLAPQAESELLRIAQEALTNVAKHARATAVDIALRCVDGRAELTVTDDGRGFEDGAEAHGHGLIGMRERAAVVGGTLSVTRTELGGTQVTAVVPVDRPNR